ncbi:hypothetical protein LIER_41617 [Lithospermum erythrorhizon]|uniref:Protein BZR1 homolog n=1 Tax=Lithospermum erythrorhizon TaxID=34254 RepID=A0AAV3RD29_LITER
MNSYQRKIHMTEVNNINKLVGFSITCCTKMEVLGCKPVESMDFAGGSTSVSPWSSFLPSAATSYNPSPASSSFPSPASSTFANNVDGHSLIPWLKNLSSASSSASSSKYPHLYIHGGSISAPVTPPLSSPTGRTPRLKRDWDGSTHAGWGRPHYSLFPSSTPPSPGRQVLPDSDWLAKIHISQSGPTSPTHTLVASNPFGFKMEDLVLGRSRMGTPVQSGTCSPAIAVGLDNSADIPMANSVSDEFAFGSSTAGLVKAWEGERIHEECVPDDLELTLGSSKTRLASSKLEH